MFRSTYTPRLVPGRSLDKNRATQLWHRTVVFSCSFLFRSTDPSSLGARGNLGILATPTGTAPCDFLCSLLSVTIIFASHPLAKVVALLCFFAFPSTHSRPVPLLSGDVVVLFDGFPTPYR